MYAALTLGLQLQHGSALACIVTAWDCLMAPVACSGMAAAQPATGTQHSTLTTTQRNGTTDLLPDLLDHNLLIGPKSRGLSAKANLRWWLCSTTKGWACWYESPRRR